MKKLIIKYFKLILFFLLISHLIYIIYRGFEYPFDSVPDFFKKLFLTLAMAIPQYIFVSVLGGVIIGFVKTKIRKT